MKKILKQKWTNLFFLFTLLIFFACENNEEIKPKSKIQNPFEPATNSIELAVIQREFEEIKNSDNFITAYNALVEINLIIDLTDFTYDELLDYAENIEGRDKYKERIEKLNFEYDYVLENSILFNESLKGLLNQNPKLRNSTIFQEYITTKLQIYSQSLKQQLVEEGNLQTRSFYNYLVLFAINREYTPWRCKSWGGVVVNYYGRMLCMKRKTAGTDVYKILPEVVIRPPRNVFPNTHSPTPNPPYNPNGRPPRPTPHHPVGGGGGFTPTPPDDDKDPPTPCEKAKTIGKHSGTKALLKDLQQKTVDNKEHGYILEKQGTKIKGHYISGSANDPQISFNINNGKVDGYIHSHYAGTLSIFSPADIFAIAQLYKNNQINNLNTFVAGVVTSQDTQYLMVIDNVAKFKKFADNLFTGNTFDKQTLDNYEEVYSTLFRIEVKNSVISNENNFLHYLRTNNTGLRLLKGDNNMEGWKSLSKDKKGNTVPDDCD